MKYKIFIPLFFFFFCAVFFVNGQNAESSPEQVSVSELEKTPIPLPAEKEKSVKLPKNLFLDTAGKLLVVLGAVYLLFLLLRKLSPESLMTRFSNRKFGVAASLPLSGKSRLVLVRFGTKLLLLSVSGDKTVKLAETADQQEVNAIIETLSESSRNK